MPAFQALLSFFLSPHGLFLMGVLDATLVFVVPFGIDAVVILLSAQNPERVWLYPILATTGSLTGASLTFWIGRQIGDKGLEGFAPKKRLDRLRARVHHKGALAMAIPALIPPPFPFKIFVLASGALEVDARRFFGAMAIMRLLRFSAEGLLATLYGGQIVEWLESDLFQTIVGGFIVVALVGSGFSLYQVIRKTRR